MKKRHKRKLISILEYISNGHISDLAGRQLSFYKAAKELEEKTKYMELSWGVDESESNVIFEAALDGFYFILKYDVEGWQVLAGVWQKVATVKDAIAFCLQQNLKLQEKTSFKKIKPKIEDIN